MKKFFYLALFLFSASQLMAQLPDCSGADSNKIFLVSAGNVYKLDPSIPPSATNPSLFITSSASLGGITISNNLNGHSFSYLLFEYSRSV
ncbi:MAG: hypothetical protein R2831_02160 [Chitinophagaceae bacterium]